MGYFPIHMSIFNNKGSLIITKSNASHEIYNVPQQYFEDNMNRNYNAQSQEKKPSTFLGI